MAHGDYGRAGVYLTTDQVNGFIPFTANANLSWDYKSRFGVSVSYNYTDENIRGAFDLTNPSRNVYMMPRNLFNVNLRYNLPRSMTVNLGVQNLFNEPQRYYRGTHDQVNQIRLQGTTITLSLEGRF